MAAGLGAYLLLSRSVPKPAADVVNRLHVTGLPPFPRAHVGGVSPPNAVTAARNAVLARGSPVDRLHVTGLPPFPRAHVGGLTPTRRPGSVATSAAGLGGALAYGLRVVKRPVAAKARPALPAEPTNALEVPVSVLGLSGLSLALDRPLEPPLSALALSGLDPELAVSIDVGAGSLAVVGYAPSLSPVLDLGAGALTLTGYGPALATVLDLAAGALAATGYAPALAITVDLGVGALALTGYAPALTPTIDLGAGTLTLTGYDPTLDVAAPADTGPTPRQRESLPPLDLRTAAVGYDRTVSTELAARSGPVVGGSRASTTDVRYRLARAGYEGADMASFFWGTKDPDDVLDYAIDWTGALNGDTIATSTFVVAVGAGLTINSQSNTTTSSTVWLSAGTAGTVYEVTCTITTAGARTFERTAQLTVEDL